MIKGLSIQTKQLGVCFWLNRRRSGNIVQQSKFPKDFWGVVSFKKSFFCIPLEDLGTVQFAFTYNEKFLPIIPLFYYILFRLISLNLHCVNHNLLLTRIKRWKHKILHHYSSDKILLFGGLFYDFWDELFSLVILPKHLRRYPFFLFHRFSLFLKDFFEFQILLRVWFGLTVTGL